MITFFLEDATETVVEETAAALTSNECTLKPIFSMLKHGVVPAIQAAIIVILIVLLIIDLGKAVMAGKEDEIKSAQKLAIKRVVYALVVFLVPWIVNTAIGLLSKAEGADENPYGNANSALQCWGLTQKIGPRQKNNFTK